MVLLVSFREGEWCGIAVVFRSLIVTDGVDVSFLVMESGTGLSPPCDTPGVIKYVKKIMQPRRLNAGDRRGSMIH